MMNLNHLLKPEHRKAGLSLEDDEDFVYLTHDNEGIALFHNSTNKQRILEIADQYLNSTELQKLHWEIGIK